MKDNPFSFQGKKAAVFGIANEHSIAWHAAKALNDHGCRIAAGYQERVKDNVIPLMEELDNPLAQVCDFTDEKLIENFFTNVEKEFQSIDILIHSVAFTKKKYLTGNFYDIDFDGYANAHKVSAYSLASVVRHAERLLNDGASVITMTYLGSQKVVTHYNIMGICKASLEASVRYLAADLGKRNIRVNSVSPGPVATLAASGIDGFEEILKITRERSLIKRNIDFEDITGTVLFLSSDLSKNITGQTIYVDAGFSMNAI